MSNTITDQLSFVEKSSVQGFLHFARQLRRLPSWDQVIVRPGVPPVLFDAQQEQPVKVQPGDLVLRVTRQARFYRLAGTIRTKDRYLLAYEIPLDITVGDPLRFAGVYLRVEDPVGQAIQILKTAYEGSARNREHNQVPARKLALGKWSSDYLTHIGVHIEQTEEGTFHSDPYQTEMSFLERQWRNQEIKLIEEQKIQQLRDKIEGEQKAFRRDLERQEKTKDQLHKISMELREVAGNEITRILQERLAEGFARGYKPGEISQEYFSLTGIFHGAQRHMEQDRLIIEAGTSIESDITQPAQPDAPSPMHPNYTAADDAVY